MASPSSLALLIHIIAFFSQKAARAGLLFQRLFLSFAVHEWRSQDTCSFIPEMPVDLGSGWEGVKPPFGGNRSLEFPLLGPAAAKNATGSKGPKSFNQTRDSFRK